MDHGNLRMGRPAAGRVTTWVSSESHEISESTRYDSKVLRLGTLSEHRKQRGCSELSLYHVSTLSFTLYYESHFFS